MRALPHHASPDRKALLVRQGLLALGVRGGAALASLAINLLVLAGAVIALRGPDIPSPGKREALVTVELRRPPPPPEPSRQDRVKQNSRLAARPQTHLAAQNTLPHAPALARTQAAAPPAPPTLIVRFAPAVAPAPPSAKPPLTDPAAALDRYRDEVWRRILAARPRDARGAGKVVVSFGIDRNGRLTFAEVAQSCGYFMLDNLALRAVHSAAPFAPPPEPLNGDLTFTVPIEFHG